MILASAADGFVFLFLILCVCLVTAPAVIWAFWKHHLRSEYGTVADRCALNLEQIEQELDSDLPDGEPLLGIAPAIETTWSKDGNGNKTSQVHHLYVCRTRSDFGIIEMSGWHHNMPRIIGREWVSLGAVSVSGDDERALKVSWSRSRRRDLEISTRADGVDAGDFIRSLRQAVREARGGRGPSAAEELARLSELHAAGALDDNDWERAKVLFLGKPANAQEEASRDLRDLWRLHQIGVLSESEFNSKKWDVLVR